jgi:creatinine deaminase
MTEPRTARESLIMDELMQAALKEAQTTRAQGGQPFGAALVRGDRIIGAGHNRVVQSGDPTSHAEIEAIRNAGRQETYADTVMYATALPCLMCAGAIVKLRIPKVMVGATWSGDGSLHFMRSRGVEVVELNLPACRQLLEQAGRTPD